LTLLIFDKLEQFTMVFLSDDSQMIRDFKFKPA
jgi:hypothetical protein